MRRAKGAESCLAAFLNGGRPRSVNDNVLELTPKEVLLGRRTLV